MASLIIGNVSATPSGKPWIEMSTVCTLSVSGYTPVGQFVFGVNSVGGEYIVASISEVGADSKLTAFNYGVAVVTVSDTGNPDAIPAQPLTIYVGSVHIADANGNSWQIFPDGSLRVTASNPTASNPKNPWLEVGSSGTVSWGEYNPQHISFVSTNLNVASMSGAAINGIGFGMTTLTLTNSDQNFTVEVPLYVGSVIIAGADGKSWQVYPDGSSRSLTTAQISQRISNLEGKNILFADVGNNNIYDATPSPMQYSVSDPMRDSTAVTCYLLNLKKVTRQG